MVLNFTKLNNYTIDPEQIHAGKPVFRLFSNESRCIQPLERVELCTGIMLFGAPSLIVKVFPSTRLLLEAGVVCLPRVITHGGEIKIALINVTIPDFLYIKNKPAQAHSALFGSHNQLVIEKGDEIATILIEKTLENLTLREII